MAKRGRAEKGVKEVKTHGADEKRQVTCTPIIDGENKLVEPTQVIWGGEEFTTDRVTKEKTDTPVTGACPKPHVADMCKEHLWHCQTKSHWCTLNSLKMLVHALAAHAVLKMVERGLDPAEQCWVFIIDCYSVHISREFLEWARFTYPNMFLLYIFAGCTAWLQPLDISFNGVFKSILRQGASLWLCRYMQDQLQLNGGDPSKVTLDLTLTFLKPLFCHWLSNAQSLMAERHSVIKRGWDESGMGRAMQLADEENGFDRTTPEFLEALALQEEGKLWEKFTERSLQTLLRLPFKGSLMICMESRPMLILLRHKL